MRVNWRRLLSKDMEETHRIPRMPDCVDNTNDGLRRLISELGDKVERIEKSLDAAGIWECTTKQLFSLFFGKNSKESGISMPARDLVLRVNSLEKRAGVVWKTKSECPGGHVKRKKESKRG